MRFNRIQRAQASRKHGAETPVTNKATTEEEDDETVMSSSEENSIFISQSTSDEEETESDEEERQIDGKKRKIRYEENEAEGTRRKATKFSMASMIESLAGRAINTMPSFTGEEDVNHFIEDMEAYLAQYTNLIEKDKIRIWRSAIKGEAREVVSGYTGEQTNTLKKCFKILKKNFKTRSRPAANLYQLKQGANEKVSVFAARIRKYVKKLGIRNAKKADKACIENLK